MQIEAIFQGYINQSLTDKTHLKEKIVVAREKMVNCKRTWREAQQEYDDGIFELYDTLNDDAVFFDPNQDPEASNPEPEKKIMTRGEKHTITKVRKAYF